MSICCALFLFYSLVFGASSVLSLTSANYDTVLAKGKVLVKYFSPNCGHCKAVAPTYEELATNFAKYSDKVTVAEVDCLANDAICGAAGVHGWPTIHFYKTGKTDYDEYDGDRSIENFSQFLSSRVGIFYKQPVAKTVILTPENWDTVVMDPTKNVLVAFTASWCGHCKNFKPQLEIAAQSFKPSDNVSFGNLDADFYKDFSAPFGVTGFPTIKFFPAAQPGEAVVEESAKAGKIYKGNQLVEPYNDERTASGVINFMNSRSGTFRLAGGGIQDFAGLESALVTPIKSLSTLLQSAGDAKAAKDAALEAVKTGVKNAYVASQYVKYINKVADAGADGLAFAKKEHDRVAGILGTGSLSDKLKFEFTVRKNILGLFK